MIAAVSKEKSFTRPLFPPVESLGIVQLPDASRTSVMSSCVLGGRRWKAFSGELGAWMYVWPFTGSPVDTIIPPLGLVPPTATAVSPLTAPLMVNIWSAPIIKVPPPLKEPTGNGPRFWTFRFVPAAAESSASWVRKLVPASKIRYPFSTDKLDIPLNIRFAALLLPL